MDSCFREVELSLADRSTTKIPSTSGWHQHTYGGSGISLSCARGGTPTYVANPSQTPGSSRFNRRSTNTPSKESASAGDRFIPNRRLIDLEASHHRLMKATPSRNAGDRGTKEEISPPAVFSPTDCRSFSLMQKSKNRSAYKQRLAFLADAAGGLCSEKKVLNFSSRENRTSEAASPAASSASTIATGDKISARRSVRYIPKFPERVLDMPGIRNDFHASLMDWSSTNDMAVALNTDVYTWHPVKKVCASIPLYGADEDPDYITAVAWDMSSRYLAIGSEMGEIKMWDREENKMLQLHTPGLCEHKASVNAFAWKSNATGTNGCLILFSGHSCGCIIQYNITSTVAFGYFVHRATVAGLKMSPDGSRLASSGMDSMVNILDIDEKKLIRRFRAHDGTAKALAWCPWQPKLLATGGGGLLDYHIRVWNVNSGQMKAEVDSKAQVCCLVWGEEFKEIFSGHGIQHNNVCVWKYPSMEMIFRLCGHRQRVLNLSIGMDGKTLASLGADESLFLWRCFDSYPDKEKTKKSTSASTSNLLPLSSPFMKSIR